MPTCLEEVLIGNEANYILPLVWQRGEDEAVIREEMARIHASGIRAVCVEARPHPNFLGPPLRTAGTQRTPWASRFAALTSAS